MCSFNVNQNLLISCFIYNFILLNYFGILRYNTFRSASGTGIFNVPGGAVVFQINENGDPMIDPLPTGIVSSDFYANVNSRFKYLNPADNYLLQKTSHGFEQGDVVCMNLESAAEEKESDGKSDG